MPTLISPAELAAALASSAPPRVLDVRWTLAQPDGREDHAAGHIPGAVYVDLDTELAEIGDPVRGRHPLPTREALEASARAWGLHDGDAVVVYDGGPSFGAARAWWLLRHVGLSQVRILDGGYAAWVLAGLQVEAGAVAATLGDVTLDWGHMRVIDGDDAADWSSHGVLLDARAGERYRGEVEPMDPIPGHIPGAVSAPTTENLGPAGFLSGAELASRFEEMGAVSGADVAVYCGSGVTAAHQIAALEIAGVEAALYPGSWSEWANTWGRPVAVGGQPG